MRGEGGVRTSSRLLTMSYHPGMTVLKLFVIGMGGALGKMNLISSNLPRRRQFSASEILHRAVQFSVRNWLEETHQPAPLLEVSQLLRPALELAQTCLRGRGP